MEKDGRTETDGGAKLTDGTDASTGARDVGVHNGNKGRARGNEAGHMTRGHGAGAHGGGTG